MKDEMVEIGVDGWLIFDFRRSNDLGCEFLKIPQGALLTRRFFYWIPKEGEPVKIVHSIENKVLNHLPGRVVEYRTWQELEMALKDVLEGSKRIAMEYSSTVPYLSKVDGGTLDLVRGFGVEVVSSAELLKEPLSGEQIESHLAAAKVVDEVVELAWQWIKGHLDLVSEYGVQQFILDEFGKRGYVVDDAPICAVNGNSANPHYSASDVKICRGDFILIDLSCKRKGGIFADITRVGVAGNPTARQSTVFEVVKEAQERALNLVEERFRGALPLMGWEVDRACRDVVQSAGFGPYFTHRTGHNLGLHIHGNGTHLDNFETKDTRKIEKSSCFTIEPGIYLPGEFGVRLEYDVLITPSGDVVVTGGRQERIKII